MDCLVKAYHGGVMSLQEYLHGILPGTIYQELIVNQRKGFQLFLSKTVVGLHTTFSVQKRTVLCTRCETDEQTQIVQEVVHEILKGGRSNVLTLGLPKSLSCDAGLSFHPDHNYPQLITPHWSKLLQIIGKSLMKDLLLNTSVFTEVASSCYIQLSGVPLHIILSEKVQPQAHSEAAEINKKKPTSHPSSQVNFSASSEEAISAVALCYDKLFYKKLHKSHPLNSLPASNNGANHLTCLIFQKNKFEKGKIIKKKIKRIPKRLKRSKHLLKQLLINFKKTRLQAFHQENFTGEYATHHRTANPIEIPLFTTKKSTPGLENEITIESKKTFNHLGIKTGATSNGTGAKDVAMEIDGKICEKNDVFGMEPVESSLKERAKSGTCQMLGGDVVSGTHFEMHTESKNFHEMENQSFALGEPICQTGITSLAVKNRMSPNTVEDTISSGGQICFMRERGNGMQDAEKEMSLEKLLTDHYSGSASSVLDGSMELFSSPDSARKVTEGLVSHEIQMIGDSFTDSSDDSGKKLDRYVECESVRKYVSMATTERNNQAEHFQKCFVNFVKDQSPPQSSGTSPDLDNKGVQENSNEKRENSLTSSETNDKEEMKKATDLQKEDLCFRQSHLKQNFEASREDALTSLSSENVLDPEQRNGSHLKRNVKMSETEVVTLVEEDNESYFDAQESLENGMDLTILGMERISKNVDVNTTLGQNIQPLLDKPPKTMTIRLAADVLDSCEDVKMNEDEFLNEECQAQLESGDVVQNVANNSDKEKHVNRDSRMKLKSSLDKAGMSHINKTVVLEGNLLESCDDVEMDENNFSCERGAVDSHVIKPSIKVMHSEQFMEKGSLPLNCGSFSKDRRTAIRNLRMQLMHKLKQKHTRRKNSVLGNFQSCKHKFCKERGQHQCYYGKRSIIAKASRRKHRNGANFDNRCPLKRSTFSRNEKDSMENQDKGNKRNTLQREHPCCPDNGLERVFSQARVKSKNISATDVAILDTREEVEISASNLNTKELSVETSLNNKNRKRIHDSTHLSVNRIKWTMSRSKQRSIKRCHHSNSNFKPSQRKTKRLLKGQIKRKKNRNILSIQFGQDSPLAMGLSGGEVYISVRGLLKEIIPEELWGSTANKNAFFKYLKLLLKLGRFEKLPLSLMTRSLKYTDCEWTRGTKEDWKRRPKTDRIKRKELMEGLFKWLVTDLVVPLIRMLYYITETSVSKNELVYYPKEMWKQMQEKAISDYKKSGVVTPVDEDNIKLMIMSQKTLGRSRIRFIPKENGFRPIVKMGKTTLSDKGKFGINLLLRDLQDVLTHLRRVHPQLFASSLLGITSIYPKWKEFIEKRHEDKETRALYFVKVDISKCYDSIPHNKLLEVVAAHLKQQNLAQKYLVRRYTVTSVSGLGDIRKKTMRHVTPVEGEQDFGHSFHQILCGLIKDGCHHKSVVTNQASCHLETVDSLLNRLRQLINYDIVTIGNLDFLRTKGISQGSVLSSLLCSIFYGNMENRYLTGVDKDGLLMRLIDDFLLVTPHLHCATKFMKVLLSGECSETFGCKVNPQKTLTNFEFTYEGQPVQQLQGDWFPWCGFLFNVKTLEVKNDYQRYVATSFRYSMTLSFSSRDTLKMMKLKLIQALHRSKGLVIFIDPLINSQRVITENIYHLFLLTAFRFHSYHQALPQLLKKSNKTQQLLKIILDIAPSFYFKAKKTLQRLPAENEFPLNLTATKWLCIKAFDVKLSRHFGVYRKLVVLLRQQRRKLARKMDSSTRHALSQGSVPDIPALFKNTRT